MRRLGRVVVGVVGVVLLTVATASVAEDQQPERVRLEGYVGGPYKLLVRDFNGDRRPDVLIGFRTLGVLQLVIGDVRGGVSHRSGAVLTDLSGREYDRSTDAACWSEPHVHNLHSADINGDGLLDVVVAVGGLSTLKTGRVVVVVGEPGGRFRTVAEYLLPSEAKGVRFADLDRDGRLDLLYTARGSGYKHDLTVGELHIRRGLAGLQFGPAVVMPAGRSAYAIDTGDLDEDGFLDVVIPNEHDDRVTYCLSPGRGCFSPAAAAAGSTRRWSVRSVQATRIPGKRSHAVNDARVADLDGDGHLDLVTANLGTSTISTFRGRGDGSFETDRQLEAGKNGAFLGLGDLDGDGDIDLVITHWTEAFVSVLLNRGDGTFAARVDWPSGLGSYGVDVADLDLDGQLDIVSANYRDKTISILKGQGDGTFAPTVTLPQGLWVSGGRFRPAP
jgi:hypothetical protein